MADEGTEDHRTPSRHGPTFTRLLDDLESVVVGQRPLLERLVVALLADGHVLIEGVPGLAKTRSVRAIARSLNLPFRRIQFTPDLLPADLLGTQVYSPTTTTFLLRSGPIVTSVLLADEINRAPAKVQSALLEAMQDRQVTIGEQTIRLPEPFWVLATQNPIDHEGTYSLPEAQLDRFLMKLIVEYPAREAELRMLDLPGIADDLETIGPRLDADDVKVLQAHTRAVRVAPAVKEYLIDLVRATRIPSSIGLPLDPMIELGASPRAAIALMRASQGHALLRGRDYVTPHDVKTIARDVLRHRVVVSFEGEAESWTPDALIGRVLDHLPVP